MSILLQSRLRHVLADPALWSVCAAVLAVMGAVGTDPADTMVGHPLGEGPGHLWIQWLIDQWWDGALLPFGQKGVVSHEQLLLVPTDLSSRLLAFLLGRLFGPVVAFNLTVAFLLALAGGSTVALARHAGATRWASALAGVFMVWAPSLLGFASDGRIDSLGVGWTGLFAPLAALALAVSAALALEGRRLWLVVAGVAWLVEVQSGPVPLPLRAADMAMPAAAQRALAATDPDRAIVTLPQAVGTDRWLQMHHGRPSVLRFRAADPGSAGDALLAAGSRPVAELMAFVGNRRGDDGRMKERLATAGVGAVVVLPGLVPPGQRAAFEARAVEALGEPTTREGGVWVFGLPEGPGRVWWPEELEALLGPEHAGDVVSGASIPPPLTLGAIPCP